MNCDKKNCPNQAITVIQFLDTDGDIHDIPVCEDCRKLECFKDFKEKI